MAQADSRLDAKTFSLIYQGEEYMAADLKASTHESLIMPMQKSSTPTSETLWNASEIEDIQSSGKKLIGYVDTSKLNTCSTMWAKWVAGKETPSWLGKQDAGYTNTYEVNFWDAGWSTVIKDRLGSLIDQGFDGVFLDDIMEYYEMESTLAVSQKARVVRDLVVDLHSYADVKLKQVHGNAYDTSAFKFIVNGAPFLIDDTSFEGTFPKAANKLAYYAAVDGVLAETISPATLPMHIKK